MAPIINILRTLGGLVWVYLDDFLIVTDSWNQAVILTRGLANLLTCLGIKVVKGKGDLQPARVVSYRDVRAIATPYHKLLRTHRGLKSLIATPALPPKALSPAMAESGPLL